MTYDELEKYADSIARIITPSVWGYWYDSTSPSALPRPPMTRTLYLRSEAMTKAWQILEVLDMATEEHRIEGWRRELNKRGCRIDQMWGEL